MSANTQGPHGASFIAVQRCCEAWNRALTANKGKGLSDWDIMKAAIKAYQRAMPFLCGEDNIRGFIAAVAEGMILGAFDMKEGTRLVYVAQVALNGLQRQARPNSGSRAASEPASESEPPADAAASPHSQSDSASGPASAVQSPAAAPAQPAAAKPDVASQPLAHSQPDTPKQPERDPGPGQDAPISIQACAADPQVPPLSVPRKPRSSSPRVPPVSKPAVARVSTSAPRPPAPNVPGPYHETTPPPPYVDSQFGTNWRNSSENPAFPSDFAHPHPAG